MFPSYDPLQLYLAETEGLDATVERTRRARRARRAQRGESPPVRSVRAAWRAASALVLVVRE